MLNSLSCRIAFLPAISQQVCCRNALRLAASFLLFVVIILLASKANKETIMIFSQAFVVSETVVCWLCVEEACACKFVDPTSVVFQLILTQHDVAMLVLDVIFC